MAICFIYLIAKKFQEELRNIKGDSNDAMGCLIKHKNDEQTRVDYKCRATIEHFQLISINDYHFTVAFKEACRPYVIRYCPKAHTKAQVIFFVIFSFKYLFIYRSNLQIKKILLGRRMSKRSHSK